MQITITGRSVAKALGVLVGIAAIVGAVFLIIKATGPDDPFAGVVDPSTFQAVVLVADRVYFGHLKEASDEFYVLEDVFYLQQTIGEDKEPLQQVQPLSTELHGPENRMLIPKEQVMVIENLRPDSQVLSVINEQFQE